MLSPSIHREEYLRRKRKIFFIKLGLVFFVLILIFVGLIFLSRMDRFRISNVEFSGGLLVSGEEVKTETLKYLEDYYFWFFPKNNIFLYPHDELEYFLKEKFKRIDTITVNSINQKTIKVEISERGMFALWCKSLEVVESDLTEKCYFMDNNGAIFSEAPTFSGNAYFKYYGFLSTSTNPIGQTYLASTTEFIEISKFVERIKQTEIIPFGLISKETGEFDLLIYPEGKIYFDKLQSFTKTAENLETLLKTIHSTTTELNVDYIDLRFGNKLFYKLKQ